MPRPATAPITPTSSTVQDILDNLETYRDSLPNSSVLGTCKTACDGWVLLLETVRDGAPGRVTDGDKPSPGEDPVYQWTFRAILDAIRGRLHGQRSTLEMDRKNQSMHTKCANVISVIAAAIKRGEAGPVAQDSKPAETAGPKAPAKAK
jgi:hypothetical protein